MCNFQHFILQYSTDWIHVSRLHGGKIWAAEAKQKCKKKYRRPVFADGAICGSPLPGDPLDQTRCRHVSPQNTRVASPFWMQSLWNCGRWMNGMVTDEWMLQCRQWCITSQSLELQMPPLSPAGAPPITLLLHPLNLWRSLPWVNVGHIMNCLRLSLFLSGRPQGGVGV